MGGCTCTVGAKPSVRFQIVSQIMKASSLCEHFLRCHFILVQITVDFLSLFITSIVTETNHFSGVLRIGLSIVSTFPF